MNPFVDEVRPGGRPKSVAEFEATRQPRYNLEDATRAQMEDAAGGKNDPGMAQLLSMLSGMNEQTPVGSNPDQTIEITIPPSTRVGGTSKMFGGQLIPNLSDKSVTLVGPPSQKESAADYFNRAGGSGPPMSYGTMLGLPEPGSDLSAGSPSLLDMMPGKPSQRTSTNPFDIPVTLPASPREESPQEYADRLEHAAKQAREVVSKGPLIDSILGLYVLVNENQVARKATPLEAPSRSQLERYPVATLLNMEKKLNGLLNPVPAKLGDEEDTGTNLPEALKKVE
jgi:hypothetical protein